MKLLYIIVFAFITIAAQSQDMQLQECIDYALQNRIEIKKYENNIVQSEQNVKYSKYSLLPSASIEAGHTFNGAKEGEYPAFQTANYSLNSQMIIFDGMQSIIKIRQSSLLNKRNKTELEILRDNVKIEVIQAYYELLIANENKQIIVRSLEKIDKQVQIIQEMVNEGKISVIDLYEIKAQNEKERKNLFQAELNRKKAYSALKKAINYPVNSDLQIADSSNLNMTYPTLSIDDAYNLALETLPQIRLSIQDSIYAHNNISIIKGQYLPYLTTTSSMLSSYSEMSISPSNESDYNFSSQFEDNFAHQLGFSLIIPLYNRHNVKQKVFESKIQLDNIILEKENIENKIYREIETLITTIQLQNNKINALQEELRLYTQVFEMRKEQYSLGSLSINDYLLSENNKTNTELEIIIEKYNLLLNIKLFDLYLGKI